MRYLAAALAALTAVLYYLIGLEVLWVGESTNGQDPGLLGFGLVVGTTFLVAAALLVLSERRWVLVAVGLLQVIVLVGYVAAASIRDPSFAPWGLVVKAPQLLILIIAAYLLVRHAPSRRSHGIGAAS